MKKTFIPLLTIFTSLSIHAAEPPLEQLRLKYQLPALGATSIQNNITKTYLTGIRKWGNPAQTTLGDKFHLGSNTKAMTATLVAIFVDRGLLRWDMTLAEIFPELGKKMNPAFRNVTIEMLTAHRSGISADLSQYRHGKLWEKLSDPNLDVMAGRKMVTRVVLRAPVSTTPGSEFEYSNTNYIIVGAILEKISGKRWENLLTDELFIPLGMNSCGFGPPGNPDAKIPDQPWGHMRTDKEPVPSFGDNPPSLGPAGTVHCSMPDYAKFIKLHLDGFNGRRTLLLNPDAFKKLHALYPGQDYTYGGWIRVDRDWAGGPALTHAGSNTLNFAEVWIAPLKNFALISVTNMADDKAIAAADEVIGALIPA